MQGSHPSAKIESEKPQSLGWQSKVPAVAAVLTHTRSSQSHQSPQSPTVTRRNSFFLAAGRGEDDAFSQSLHQATANSSHRCLRALLHLQKIFCWSSSEFAAVIPTHGAEGKGNVLLGSNSRMEFRLKHGYRKCKCMGTGATPGTRLKGKVCMKQYRAPERTSAKKRGASWPKDKVSGRQRTGLEPVNSQRRSGAL